MNDKLINILVDVITTALTIYGNMIHEGPLTPEEFKKKLLEEIKEE